MAMQKIKVGGYVSEEVAKINANFTEVETDYAKKTELPSVPTKTSQLTNDSNFATTTQVQQAVAGIDVPTKTSELTNDSGYMTGTQVANGYVAKETGKGLSTNDYTAAEKNKLAGLSAPENKTFTTGNWTASGDQFTCTIAANGKKPGIVMRNNTTGHRMALVDVAVSGANIVLTSDEAFDGYIVCI